MVMRRAGIKWCFAFLWPKKEKQKQGKKKTTKLKSEESRQKPPESSSSNLYGESSSLRTNKTQWLVTGLESLGSANFHQGNCHVIDVCRLKELEECLRLFSV